MDEYDVHVLVMVVIIVSFMGGYLLFVWNLEINECQAYASFSNSDDWLWTTSEGCLLLVNDTVYHICEGIRTTESCKGGLK